MQNKQSGLETTLTEQDLAEKVAHTRTKPQSSGWELPLVPAFQLYEQRLVEHRTHFGKHRLLAGTTSGRVNPVAIECSLIYYCALGSAITEPVEGWIRRAGERCKELGLTSLGQVLIQHSKSEAGHQLLMMEDTRQLVAHWNARYLPTLDAEQLLAQSLTPGVKYYCDLHEEILSGDAPFAQLAVEYEIERLSIDRGPQLLQRFEQVLGPEITKRLSFLEEHVLLDEAHSKLNARQLANLLADHPEYLEIMVEAGIASLKSYSAFLDDCVRLTQATFKEARPL